MSNIRSCLRDHREQQDECSPLCYNDDSFGCNGLGKQDRLVLFDEALIVILILGASSIEGSMLGKNMTWSSFTDHIQPERCHVIISIKYKLINYDIFVHPAPSPRRYQL